jgi:hypothetical protein
LRVAIAVFRDKTQRAKNSLSRLHFVQLFEYHSTLTGIAQDLFPLFFAAPHFCSPPQQTMLECTTFLSHSPLKSLSKICLLSKVPRVNGLATGFFFFESVRLAE